MRDLFNTYMLKMSGYDRAEMLIEEGCRVFKPDSEICRGCPIRTVCNFMYAIDISLGAYDLGCIAAAKQYLKPVWSREVHG